jgi:hypothetical protein
MGKCNGHLRRGTAHCTHFDEEISKDGYLVLFAFAVGSVDLVGGLVFDIVIIVEQDRKSGPERPTSVGGEGYYTQSSPDAVHRSCRSLIVAIF